MEEDLDGVFFRRHPTITDFLQPGFGRAFFRAPLAVLA